MEFLGFLRGYLYFLYLDGVRTSQETCGPPGPVTGISLLFICRRFSYLTGGMRASTSCYGNGFTRLLDTKPRARADVRALYADLASLRYFLKKSNSIP
jgi:hypothetical protein